MLTLNALELLADAYLIKLRLEVLQTRAAFAAQSPIAALFVVLGSAVNCPATRKRLGEFQARRHRAEGGQALIRAVKGVGISEVPRRKRWTSGRVIHRVVIEIRSALRGVAEA